MDLATLKAMQQSPAEFRRRLMIDTDRGVKPCGESLDLWQRADFLALDSSWLRVALRADAAERPAFGRAYLERPRGHSKTTDLAVMASWAMFAAPLRLTGIAGAAKKDQAKLLIDAVDRLVRLNTWLPLKVEEFRVRNVHTGSALEVLTSQGATNFGQLPDFIICDELTHWQKRALWTALFSAAPKRAHCLLLVISNAGWNEGHGWQWRVRENARQSDRWYFSRINGPQASWMSEADLEEQRQVLLPLDYRRLWLNEWTPAKGDALQPADVAACLTDKPRWTHPREKTFFVAGIDLGVRRDHAAMCVLGCDADAGRMATPVVKSFAPEPPRDEVDLEAMFHAVVNAWQYFGLAVVAYDPQQAGLFAQLLAKRGVPLVAVPFSNLKNVTNMAATLVQIIRDRRITFWRDQTELLADLHKLCIEQTGYGLKLTAPRDADGHADRATALAIVLPLAIELAAAGYGLKPSEPDGLGRNVLWALWATEWMAGIQDDLRAMAEVEHERYRLQLEQDLRYKRDNWAETALANWGRREGLL